MSLHIDFTRPLHPVDGIYDYVFSMRDLGSHWHLIWMPVTAETAKAIVPILWALFIQEGAPLVLKNDLGSAFIAELTQVTLLEAAVAQLFSPPRCPQYNGALERSNGTLKIYTQQQAASAGHSFRWTSDDLERARQLANTISRPWGREGPTPEEAWQLKRLEHTVLIYDIMMEAVLEKKGLWQNGVQPVSDEDAFKTLIQRVLESTRYTGEQLADSLHFAVISGNLACLRENDNIQWKWVDHL